MNVYTTKAGVKIGLLYQPKAPVLSHDEEIIQSVLLRDHRVVWHRRLTDSLGYLFLVVLTLMLAWAAV